MNEQLEQVFGRHFNGTHYQDITKEMICKFAVDYAHLKVEEEKQSIREFLQSDGYDLLAESIN